MIISNAWKPAPLLEFVTAMVVCCALSTAAKSNTFVVQAEVISNRCAIYLLGPSKVSVVLFLLHKQPCNRNRRTKTLRQNPKLSIEITGLRQNCTQDQKTYIKAQAWFR